MNDSNSTRWREAFQAQAQDAQALAADLSLGAFNHAPEAGAWSVGQCLDHLCTTGGLLVPRLRKALGEARNAGRHASVGGEPHLRLRDRLFVWVNSPDAWLKIPAPGLYRPREGALNPEDTVQAFGKLQDGLAACAEAADGLDWSAIMVASPASRLLRLSAGGWLEGTLTHQRRHLRQAQRLV